MRKNDLIKKLLAMPGNPEILMYNGFVDDWHHIELAETTLKRLKPSVRAGIIMNQKGCDMAKAMSYIKKKPSKWELDSYGFMSERPDLRDEKRVVLIQGKRRGIRTFDRSGSIEY